MPKRKRKSEKNKVIPKEVIPEANSLASDVLTNIFPVVQKIFQYLSYKSLCYAAQVCKLWSSTATTEYQHRLSFDARLMPVPDSDKKGKVKLDRFNDYLDEIRIQPDVLIRSTMDQYGENFIVPKLPPGTIFINGQTNGVIGPEGIGGPCKELESPFFPGHSFLSFQRSKNLELSYFLIKDDTRIEKDMNFNDICSKDVSEIENPVVLIFTTYLKRMDTNTLIKYMKKTFERTTLTIIGGKCMDLSVSISQDQMVKHCTAGIILSGTFLKSSDLIIVNDNKNPEVLETSLQEMKLKMSKRFTNGKLDISRCIMILISCIGKGEEYYGKSNVESDLIHKVFPGVNVYGYFGQGEIGYDRHQNEEFCFYTYAYTSVLCLLSF